MALNCLFLRQIGRLSIVEIHIGYSAKSCVIRLGIL